MHEYKRTFTLPTLHVTLPCAPSQEIICIGGGRAPETGWLIGLIQQRNMCGPDTPIWAIDRGVNICHSANQVPAHLIGDGDSADSGAWTWAKESGAQVHTFPPEKDFTDTELALQIAADQYTHPLVILTAAFGGRLDHLMSTASVAAHASIPCVLADERETLFYLHAGESLTVTCDTPPTCHLAPPLYGEMYGRNNAWAVLGAAGCVHHKSCVTCNQQRARTRKHQEHVYRLHQEWRSRCLSLP